MKRFEKCLKSVLNRYNAECVPVYCPSLPDISEAEFRFLSAKGLVELISDGDDTFYANPTPRGLTYFNDKSEDNRRFWKEHVVNFIGGFVSGVLTTLLGALAVQVLL